MKIKILTISIVLLCSSIVFGQNEKRIYFSDSPFCLTKSDGYVRGSFSSLDLGMYEEYSDTLYLNTYTMNRVNEAALLPIAALDRDVHEFQYAEVASKPGESMSSQWQYDAGTNIWWPVNRHYFKADGTDYNQSMVNRMGGCSLNGVYSTLCSYTQPPVASQNDGGVGRSPAPGDPIELWTPVAAYTLAQIREIRDGIPVDILNLYKNIVGELPAGSVNNRINSIYVYLNSAIFNLEDVVDIRNQISQNLGVSSARIISSSQASPMNVTLNPFLNDNVAYTYNVFVEYDLQFIIPADIQLNQIQTGHP